MGRRVKGVKQAGDQTFNIEGNATMTQKVTPHKLFRYREQSQQINSQKGAFFLHVIFSHNVL